MEEETLKYISSFFFSNRDQKTSFECSVRYCIFNIMSRIKQHKKQPNRTADGKHSRFLNISVISLVVLIILAICIVYPLSNLKRDFIS